MSLQRARATCLIGAGILAVMQGEYQMSGARIEGALSLYRALSDPLGEAEALTGQGMIRGELGDHDGASLYFQRALTLQERHGDKHGASASYRNLGNMAYYKGDCDRARMLLKKSLSLTHELGDKVGEGFDLIVLGNVALIQGDNAEANRLYRQSMALRHEIGAPLGVVACIQGMLIATQRAGEHATAAWLLGVEEGARTRLGMALAPTDSSIYSDAIACIQEHLREEVFGRIRAQGRETPLDEAVSAILEEHVHERIQSLSGSRMSHRRPLTPREREIALLVARGMTNRDIAGELAISQRTVDAHVSAIMSKLDVRSRAGVMGRVE